VKVLVIMAVALCFLSGCAGIGARQLALGQACSQAYYAEGEVQMVQTAGRLKVGDPNIIDNYTSRLDKVCRKTYPTGDDIAYAQRAADELELLYSIRK
jgi:hypothetical protein